MRCTPDSITSPVRFRPACLAALLLVVGAATTPAVAVSFGFDIGFTSGSLAGQSFSGLIETTSGDGPKFPGDGSLISFDITVDGISFTELDDVDYPDFPLAGIFSGELLLLDFLSDPTQDPFLEIFLTPFEESVNVVAFADREGNFSEGSVTRTYNIPEPDMGLGGVVFVLILAGATVRERVTRTMTGRS